MGRAKEYVRIFASDKKGRALEHHYLNAKKWAAPAGKIEKGEAPARAAIRELVERTGYTAESVKSIGKKRDETGALFHEFEASGVSAVGKPQTEIRWKKANMNPFLAGFLSELSKEGMLVPRQGLTAAKAGVRMAEEFAFRSGGESGRRLSAARRGYQLATHKMRQDMPIGHPSAPQGKFAPASSKSVPRGGFEREVGPTEARKVNPFAAQSPFRLKEASVQRPGRGPVKLASGGLKS